jgi:hypothetical protein
MENIGCGVNRFFNFLTLPTAPEALPSLALPLPRAPLSGARKVEILVIPLQACKR